MMRAVRVTVVLRVITGDVIGAIGHHRGMVMVVSRHASILMERGHPFSPTCEDSHFMETAAND